jgi:membrane-associated phospholipid phosphatase
MHVTTSRRVSPRGLAAEPSLPSLPSLPLLPLLPLLPGRLRILAAGLLAACVAVPVVLAAEFVGHGQPGSLDSAIDPVIMNLWRDSVLRHDLADLGTLRPVALMTLALVVACVATRRWSGAVLAAVGVAAATSLTRYVLEPYVGGSLGQGFPSGRTTSMFALAAVCVVLLADPPGRRVSRAVRLLTAFMAVALATAVAVTAIAIGTRHFTDTLAGAAVGTGVALACALGLDLVSSRVYRRPASASADHEARVWRYFHEYVDCGKPGYAYVIRHPGKSLGALLALFRLLSFQVTPSSAGVEGSAIQAVLSSRVTALLSPRSVLTRLAGFATAVLILPLEPAEYSLGAAKQTLRRKVRSAHRLGVRWAEVTDLQERQRLLKLGEEYERTHPDATYRNPAPDLSGLLRYRLWLAAYSADGSPLLLSVTPVDGELAALAYFRTIGAGEGQSEARYLMTQVLVEHLVDRRVRYLLDGGSLALPNGIRQFQRMTGFRIIRIRVGRALRSLPRALRPGRRGRVWSSGGR